MEQKQTAVEFAVAKLEKFIPKGNQIAIDAILNQAKEMEKQQIMDAWDDGNDNEIRGGKYRRIIREKYYNEEYGKQ